MKLILYVLVAFIAIVSTTSGLLMITYPDGDTLGLPLSILAETPFKSFRVPGICLALLVGGTNFIALYTLITRSKNNLYWAMFGGFITFAWITIQAIFIQTLIWSDFLYFGIGLLVLLIAYHLKNRWAI